MTAAVYNYSRRSALLNEFMVNLFGLPAMSYYDDKFGFEPEDSVDHAHSAVQSVHSWLGAKFDDAKCQKGGKVEILGVEYDLNDMMLRIKPKRKEEIVAWIDKILRERRSWIRVRQGNSKECSCSLPHRFGER